MYLRKLTIILITVFSVTALFGCSKNEDFLVIYETYGGNSIPSSIVKSGSSIEVPSSSKEGYFIEGWYTSINDGLTFDRKWDFSSDIVKTNMTLYANWLLIINEDIQAIILNFENSTLAASFIKHYGIKFDTSGNMYVIPDIRADVEDSAYININHSDYVHVKNLLINIGINYISPSSITDLEYEQYYNNYTVSTNRNQGISDTPLTIVEIRALYLKMYNALYGKNITQNNRIFYDNLGNVYNFTIEKSAPYRNVKDLFDYILTLLAESQFNLEYLNHPNQGPFSSRVRYFEGKAYLVYLIHA